MKTVLVVEDNIGVAEYIRDIFEVQGYNVRVAYDGADGWEDIQSELPDVVISDLEMPEVDGYELLHRVRHNKATQTLPFILLTARSERENVRRGMTGGADDYVTKPFSAKEIIESVETMLSKHDVFQEKEDTTLRLLRKNITYALPHELRTPLQSVLGYANLMQMDHETISPEDIEMMSGMIFDAGLRLQRLIENSLAYAQIEIIASDPEQQEQLRNNILRDPINIIEGCAETIAEQYNRHDDLEMQLDHKVLRISEDNLSHIIEELLTNAFKFSSAGTPIKIQTTASDKHYTIKICDKGRGMTPEQIQLVGPYMQFERVLYEQQGTGLGLTIAKRLVELHKGVFKIKSQPEQGTCIIIKLEV